MSPNLHLFVAAVCLCGALLTGTAHAQSWPTVKVPDGASVQTVANDMVLNGLPARIFRIEVKGTPAEVLDFYREQFGSRHVENALNGSHVIATRQGDHFHTVQIESTGAKTVQVTVMTTQVHGGLGRSAVEADTKQLMPPASSVLTSMQSRDAGKRSMLLLAANTVGMQANRDHLVRALGERGFRLVSESAAPGGESMSLLFASGTEEAVVTITDAGRYRSVLINRTAEPK